MIKWICLGLGGLSGTFMRYILAKNINQMMGGALPYGTLVVNLAGCFLVGFLAILADKKFLLDEPAKILLIVGFCGAFTTFSAFMLETAHLISHGETFRALGYVLLSVLAGFLFLRLGVWAGELI